MEQNSLISESLARQALEEYGLEDPTLDFIRHSDTCSFRVSTPAGGNYLLRLHVPITHSMGTHGTDYAAVTSELLWLEALCQDTDLVLQQPIRNRSGSLVTQVHWFEAQKKVNTTLLCWLDEDAYYRDLETPDTAFQIGVIAARLHNHACHWQIPPAFTRPGRDIPYFQNVLQGIQPAVADGRISPSDYTVLEKSIQILIEQLRGLSKDRQAFGLMHADMHKGNMLLQQGQIRLIDFSFCAFGNFMFDLAICLSDMKKELHPAFLAGYQSLRSLPNGYQLLVEGLFVGSMVGAFSYWVTNPNAASLLLEKVPRIVTEYAQKYIHGEHFWFEP